MAGVLARADGGPEREHATGQAEARLAALARGGGALRRVLAALAGRLVARRAYEPLGYARLGDYARERLGVSARGLQELAQVDARLAALPRLEVALVSGGLPWSKVRLVARCASAENEARLIARAQGASVRTLERELRAANRGALGSDLPEDHPAEPMARVVVPIPRELAFKWQRTCRYAARVAGETTRAADVLEWVTAEVLASGAEAFEGQLPGEEEGLAPTPEPESADEDEATEPANVCAAQRPGEDLPSPETAELPHFLRPLVADLAALDPFALDTRLRQAIRLEQRLDAEIAPLLRVVTSPEYEWQGPYQSLGAFVRDRLGMSPRKARALLRLERVGERCPALRSAWRDGALSWVQAHTLARLVLEGESENAWLPAWIRFAQGVTVRKLDESVGRALLWRETDPDARAHEDPERVASSQRDDPCEEPSDAGWQTCAPPRGTRVDIRLRVHAPREVARLFRAALCSVRLALERTREPRRLPSEAEGLDAMLDHALRAWQVEDRWLRTRSRRKNEIFERDGWRCTVPGCTSRRNLHSHHIRFRSAGGSDAAENQTTLCAFHHQQGVHAGRVRVTGTAPDGLWFELGVRRGHPPLARFRSGDRCA